PAPPGFEAVSRRLPQFLVLAQNYLPPGNRLVEAYLLPEDIAKLELGEDVDIRRYFQLQTLRTLDGVPVSATEFAEVSGQIEKSLGEALTNFGEQGAQLAAQGNAAAKRQVGVDPQVGLGGVQYLGTFRKEPWALFFTTRATVTTPGSGSTPATAASALAVIDHQVAYLYAYTYENDASPHGRGWAQDAVSEWANTVRWANPDDPALEARAKRLGGGFDWEAVGRAAGIGAFIAIVVGFLRQRRKS
ncbi:MAG TPA: hypothetical protein VFL14_13805, partial [Xanthomonadales bacterium]|nr:hypothetical protein [Xanthomonadales bacterium]